MQRPPDNVARHLQLGLLRLEQRVRPGLVVPQLPLQPQAVVLRGAARHPSCASSRRACRCRIAVAPQRLNQPARAHQRHTLAACRRCSAAAASACSASSSPCSLSRPSAPAASACCFSRCSLQACRAQGQQAQQWAPPALNFAARQCVAPQSKPSAQQHSSAPVDLALHLRDRLLHAPPLRLLLLPDLLHLAPRRLQLASHGGGLRGAHQAAQVAHFGCAQLAGWPSSQGQYTGTPACSTNFGAELAPHLARVLVHAPRRLALPVGRGPRRRLRPFLRRLHLPLLGLQLRRQRLLVLQGEACQAALQSCNASVAS